MLSERTKIMLHDKSFTPNHLLIGIIRVNNQIKNPNFVLLPMQKFLICFLSKIPTIWGCSVVLKHYGILLYYSILCYVILYYVIYVIKLFRYGGGGLEIYKILGYEI